MDKFSELIAKGVARFEHTPIAPEIPVVCPICRTYNNIFGAVTDTHMSPMSDGTLIITGHMVADKRKFDQFLWMPMYMGGNFILSGYYSFADFMSKFGLRGSYEVINNDMVYVLKPGKMDAKDTPKEVVITLPAGASFTTQESIIPQNSRFLTNSNSIKDICECLVGEPEEAAQKLNESRYVQGNNWVPVYMSDGVRMTCVLGNKSILLS